MNHGSDKTAFQVETYDGETGHGEPKQTLEVSGGQGLTVSFPPDKNGDVADLYIERRSDGRWVIMFSPDGMDIRASIDQHDDGHMFVKDAKLTIFDQGDADLLNAQHMRWRRLIGRSLQQRSRMGLNLPMPSPMKVESVGDIVAAA